MKTLARDLQEGDRFTLNLMRDVDVTVASVEFTGAKAMGTDTRIVLIRFSSAPKVIKGYEVPEDREIEVWNFERRANRGREV